MVAQVTLKQLIDDLGKVSPQTVYRPDVIIVPEELKVEVEEALKGPFILTDEDREYYRRLRLI